MVDSATTSTVTDAQYEAKSQAFTDLNVELNVMIGKNVDTDGNPLPNTDEIRMKKADLQDAREELDALHRELVLKDVPRDENGQLENVDPQGNITKEEK